MSRTKKNLHRKKGNRRHGGAGLTDLAVPTALLLMNNYNPLGKGKRFFASSSRSKSMRRSRRRK